MVKEFPSLMSCCELASLLALLVLSLKLCTFKSIMAFRALACRFDLSLNMFCRQTAVIKADSVSEISAITIW